MADRDILARMDEHLERGNAHMERGNEHMERGNELMDAVRDEMRLTREFMADQAGVAAGQVSVMVGMVGQLSDTRAFANQQMARLDRMLRDNARIMDGKVDELRRLNDELERQGDERREESRVGREALFAVIDRMNRFHPPDARG